VEGEEVKVKKDSEGRGNLQLRGIMKISFAGIVKCTFSEVWDNQKQRT